MKSKLPWDVHYLDGWTRAAVTVNSLLDPDLTPLPGALAAVRFLRHEAYAHTSPTVKGIIARGECEAFAVALGDA